MRTKYASLQCTIQQGSYDIILLQETLLPINKNLNFSGYNSFISPSNQEARGLITLIKNTIPASSISNPIYCGEQVEVQAVKIQLLNQNLNLYNIYKQQNGTLDIGELFSQAAIEPTFIGGDFNAHHEMLSSPQNSNTDGEHIASLLEEISNITLLNSGEATHIRGGRLDLSFISIELRHLATWQVHPTLMSDHYGIIINITIPKIPPPPPPPPKWDQNKADWNKFQNSISTWLATYTPTDDIDQLESDLCQALHRAANCSMPKTNSKTHNFKDAWYYNQEVKNLKNRLNRVRKLYRKRPTDEIRAVLQQVVKDVHHQLSIIKNNKWLEWCAKLNQHTNIKELWLWLKRVAGKKTTKTPTHPNPKQEAERLANNFANRSASHQLPQATQMTQTHLYNSRWEAINQACALPDSTDTPFTTHELHATHHKGRDTAPGADKITYTMINNMGEAGDTAYLLLLNTTYTKHIRPVVWNQADTQPIPKPKDPNNPRPISLLSCLEKVGEKMVLKRLQHKIGPLHPHLYAYRNNVGTTECITDVLSCINNKAAIAVFLDLEKAFELASPAAILHSLTLKGVKGHLLAWTKNYTINRQARVKFQGEISSYKVLENGTPQGGILSPFLFNILMEHIAQLPLPSAVDIFIFADDVVIISRGAHKITNMQRALDTIASKITELGLKINSNKTKAMAIKTKTPPNLLTLQNQNIEWVNNFMYLGVYIDQNLTFQKQIKFLREKANTRLAPMRYMTSLEGGAGYQVQRTFYISAIRSLIDYSAPTLAYLSAVQISNLEVLQNNAMRLMLGAPMWTRICNLQMETNLPPLAARIQVRNTNIATKALLSERNSIFQRRIKDDLNRHPDLPIPKTYAAHIGENIRNCNMGNTLSQISPDTTHPNYTPTAPWEPFPAVLNYTALPASKAACAPDTLRRAAQLSINNAESNGCSSYYTDGSVNPDTQATGAAVFSNKFTASWRTSNSCSTLQTELAAIKQALTYSISNERGPVVIHTDSMSSLQALKQTRLKENINLITSILGLLKQHQLQGRQVTLNWIPSHIGIHGNDKADELAKQAIMSTTIQYQIQPSLQQFKGKTKPSLQQAHPIHHNYWVNHNSPSATWYKEATLLEPSPITKNTPRKLAVIIARLRLGYKCCWEIIQPRDRECSHCNQLTNKPLLHYLLECPITISLRNGLDNPVFANHINATTIAAQIVYNILGQLELHQHTLLTYPPPR